MLTPNDLNLRVLRRSRPKLKPGDIFALQILPDRFHFGRVIRTDTEMIGTQVFLIYIFRATSPSRNDIPQLDRNDLLLPPTFVEKGPWTRGFFEVVKEQPLEVNDTHPVHCFVWLSADRFVDEYCEPLPCRSEPCGRYQLSFEGSIDDKISDALGIPRCAASVAASQASARRTEEVRKIKEARALRKQQKERKKKR